MKPPRGVETLKLWRERHPEPDIADLVARYAAVSRAVDRRLEAKLPVPPEWYQELGTQRHP